MRGQMIVISLITLLHVSGVSMAMKMPSATLKKECAAILESMKVSLLHLL